MTVLLAVSGLLAITGLLAIFLAVTGLLTVLRLLAVTGLLAVIRLAGSRLLAVLRRLAVAGLLTVTGLGLPWLGPWVRGRRSLPRLLAVGRRLALARTCVGFTGLTCRRAPGVGLGRLVLITRICVRVIAPLCHLTVSLFELSVCCST